MKINSSGGTIIILRLDSWTENHLDSRLRLTFKRTKNDTRINALLLI